MTHLSFIIPLLNEEQSLKKLYEKIIAAIAPFNYSYEIIFVDDGSTDESFKIIQKIREKDPSVKIIRFRKNFGKSTALNQGFRFAEGDIIFTLDADLQDDPKEIPRFISKIKEGFDLVSGWKQSRKDSVLMKNLPSKLFNFAVGRIVGLKIHDYNCGFKAYRKQLAKNLSLYGDLHRYIPALAFSQGYKVAEIPVEHHARRHGKSKFGLERFTHGLFDFLTITFLIKFLKRPMHFFGWFGGTLLSLGFWVCAYLSVLWVGGESIGNRPLLILGILLILVGMQMLSTGLIAEMIVHSQKRSEEDIIEYISGWGNHEPYENRITRIVL